MRLAGMLVLAFLVCTGFVEGVEKIGGEYKVAGASGIRVVAGIAEVLPAFDKNAQYQQPFNPED